MLQFPSVSLGMFGNNLKPFGINLLDEGLPWLGKVYLDSLSVRQRALGSEGSRESGWHLTGDMS